MKFKKINLKCRGCSELMQVIIKTPDFFQPTICKETCRFCKSSYVFAFQKGKGLQENQCIMKIAKFEKSEEAKRIQNERNPRLTPGDLKPNEA